jgi:succinate dehydrogenase / fumarate reductase membrane anchor subunit
MSLKNLAGKVKGHGSSKFSTLHFIRQRFTAIILVPLFIWLIFCIVNLIKSSSSENVILFISHPMNFTLIVIFILFFLYHGYLGMNDIMKDYIKCETLYKFLNKTLLVICILTYFVSITNFIFYHLLFRYFSGMS